MTVQLIWSFFLRAETATLTFRAVKDLILFRCSAIHEISPALEKNVDIPFNLSDEVERCKHEIQNIIQELLIMIVSAHRGLIYTR